MIDTVVRLLDRAALPAIGGLEERYALVTLHRPSNVDEAGRLQEILEALQEISEEVQVVFPLHPRTRERLAATGFPLDGSRLRITEPLGYLEFLALQRSATVVITDSGGIQEETTYLGIPCLTVRENTERPVTVDLGTNILVGRDMTKLVSETRKIVRGQGKRGSIPPLWDGKAGERVARVVAAL
jgi:UDP-N-acetylglucosamine 2-epimerase (non-hydrolysing)